jgi:hypothetical protein
MLLVCISNIWPVLFKTYRKKSEIWPRRTLGRNWEHWAEIWDIGQILRTLSKHMGHWAEIGDIWQTLGRCWAYLVIEQTFADIGQTLGRHPRWDFSVSLSKMRLFGFLIQNETFRILIQDKNLNAWRRKKLILRPLRTLRSKTTLLYYSDNSTSPQICPEIAEVI